VLAVNVYRTMDKVMVSAIAGVHENGLYENAEKIIYCLSGFISAIGTVMMPKVAHMQKEGATEKIARHIDRSMELILCMTSAMAFGVAAVADVFAPLFYGEDFRYSGTLMAPLAFTLIMIGFANVIRTQVVLPQKRDHIFVKSVCCGAAVNLIANACLIPSMKSMGAVVGTLMAEMTVPVVQYIILRKELPYGQFLKYVGIYAVFGGIMLGCVRLVKTLVPAETWLSLGIMTAAGIAVYAGLCIGYWKMTKKNFRELNQ
jgi:O-antigen/teichoic acid export membrane protein